MLIIEHTEQTKASPDQVWRVWEDVENWKSWDHGIEYSTLDGPFAEGSCGELKPKEGPLVKTRLTHVDPMNAFVDEAKLPLTRIIVHHSLVVDEGVTRVTHRIEMQGVLAFFFAIVIGRTMKENLPHEMAAMVKRAEQL